MTQPPKVTDYGLMLKALMDKYNFAHDAQDALLRAHPRWKSMGKAMRSPVWGIGSKYI